MIRAIRAHGAEMNDLGDYRSVSRAHFNHVCELNLSNDYYYTNELNSNMSAAPKEFLDYVDGHKDAFIKRLADAVAIPR